MDAGKDHRAHPGSSRRIRPLMTRDGHIGQALSLHRRQLLNLPVAPCRAKGPEHRRNPALGWVRLIFRGRRRNSPRSLEEMTWL
jgi:hypothetical protein